MNKTRPVIAIALLFIGVTGGAILLSLAVIGPDTRPVRATGLGNCEDFRNVRELEHRALQEAFEERHRPTWEGVSLSPE